MPKIRADQQADPLLLLTDGCEAITRSGEDVPRSASPLSAPAGTSLMAVTAMASTFSAWRGITGWRSFSRSSYHAAWEARGMLRRVLVIAAVAAAHPAQAVEVGDVVWLSSNGVSLTVTETHRIDRETVSLTAKQMATNASEYCERYEQLTPDSPKWKACVKEGTSATATTVAVNCRTRTIILGGQASGSGSYRPGESGGPWTSVANPNWIIQGDSVFKAACRR